MARPGQGWPEDPATARTPVAHTAEDVLALAAAARDVDALNARVSVCRACPRLVAWREQVAQEKRRAFATESYWGRPVPSFGATAPRVLIVGLAPAAHGGNRTGRMFTGDRSGDFLYASMYRVGLANQPTATHAGDGLTVPQTRMIAPVHCAPPANKPTPTERDTCGGWLRRELSFVWPSVRAVVALGGFAWQALWPALATTGLAVPARPPAFAHGVEAQVDGRLLLGCYHVSQQNTFTGRLTPPMLDAVLARAASAAAAT